MSTAIPTSSRDDRPRIAWAFTHVYASNWHPLTWLSHHARLPAYGQWAGGHHLTNVLLHAATAVLLFLVLRRMTGRCGPRWRRRCSPCIRCGWNRWPGWPSARRLERPVLHADALRLRRYAARPFSWRRYLAVVVLFALGLMAKPMLVTLPCVLLLLDYWPLGRFRIGRLQTPTRAFALVSLSLRERVGVRGTALDGRIAWAESSQAPPHPGHRLKVGRSRRERGILCRPDDCSWRSFRSWHFRPPRAL